MQLDVPERFLPLLRKLRRAGCFQRRRNDGRERFARRGLPNARRGPDRQIGACVGTPLKHYTARQTLFKAGDHDFKFFVVQSGEVEIVDLSGDKPRTVAVHRPGEFTGEISHLTGSPAVVSAVARTDCEVYGIASDGLRQILNQCPDLSDIILQAFIARRQLLRESPDFTGLRVIGSRYSPDTFRVRDFLAKNRVLFTWVDLETDPQVDQLLKQFGLTEADTPVVACGRMVLLRNPSNRQLADAIGIRQPLEQTVYDLVVVGAGPAGLAAAVYGASEGLSTVVLERTAPGGQAGSSMRIENYLGFPTGLTGSELADRAVLQANKFGARLSVPTPVAGLTFEKAYPVLRLDGGETVAAKCLLIATGADYRRLEVEGCERFEGRGVYYAATPNEAHAVPGRRSGGGRRRQLRGPGRRLPRRRRPARCYLLIRGDDLYKNMSSYLARRIEQTPNIELLRNTTIRRMYGDEPPHRGRDRQRTDGRGADGRDAGGVQLHRRRPANRLAAPGDREGRQGIRPDRRGAGAVAALDRPARSRSCWRRAGRACSPPGTCAPARSSASPRPSARARWPSSSCMSI